MAIGGTSSCGSSSRPRENSTPMPAASSRSFATPRPRVRILPVRGSSRSSGSTSRERARTPGRAREEPRMAIEADDRDDGIPPGGESGNAFAGAGSGPEAPRGDGEDVAELRKRAEERDAYRSEALRARADFDNLQKRTRKDRAMWEDQAVRRFVRDLLPIIDNFERALASAS